MARLPSEESVKRALRYRRLTPPVPANLRDFTLPDEWKQTSGPDPQPFLLYDN